MSVLYPHALRTDYRKSVTENCNSALRFLLFFLIASLSYQGVFAQDEKEIQERKDAELKSQEAVQLESKIKANSNNPKFLQRLGLTTKSSQLPALSPEQEKKNINAKIAEEKAIYNAKRAEELKAGNSLSGVEYKVITTGGQVEYVVTNARREIFRQQVNTPGSLYGRQVQAEKEAIYAANTFIRNVNYPVDALQSEIRSLVNAPKSTPSIVQTNRNQRTTADYTFNGGGGNIPATGTSGVASPYPATITVSGVPAGATVKEIKITGLNHTWPNDIDIAVQSPAGTNVYLMSDAGGSTDLVNIDYTFNDGAATNLLDEAFSPSGSYKPSNFEGSDNFAAPGPGTAVSSVTLSTFGSGNHNGTWNLFVVDDLGGDSGNWGSWSITFTDPVATCFPIAITGQPANATVCSGANTSFTVTAGPAGVSYNWQVNTGSGFTYLTNGGVYSGVNAATLNITGATTAMNGYQYRCVLVCSQGGLPEISNPATLTVNTSPGSPAVTPSSAAICPGGSQLLTVYVNPTSFSGGPGVAIPGSGTGTSTGAPGNPYPSTISVAGLPVATVVKSVTINGLTHTFPGDIDIVLKSPAGVSVILMSDIYFGSVTNVNYTLDDGAASLLSNAAVNPSGTYRPTNYTTPDNFPAPGPGSLTQATPSLSSFGNGNNNGNWELYIVDDAGGDIGTIANWSITFAEPGSGIFYPSTGLFTDAGLTTPYTAGTAVGSVYASPAATTTYGVTVDNGTCASVPTNVTITVNQPPAVTVQPASSTTACVGGTKSLSVTATGSGLTYQWQVSTNGGTSYSNITASANNPSGFIYTGFTTATLNITDVMATMNGYLYRCVVSGSCTPAATSNATTLAVNALPAISVTKDSQCSPTVLTASGASTYAWSPSTGLSATTGTSVTASPTANTIYTVTGTDAVSGCVNTTQVDVKFTPAIPTVAPAAPIICAGSIQQLSITSATASSTPPAANTTSSGAISVVIPDDEPINGATSSLVVSGVTGSVQSISVNFNITHTWDSDLDINLVAPNGNILNLVGARGGSGDNFTNTTISSTSITSLGSATAPFTGTFAADGFIGWGPASLASNVSTFASLFSVPNGTWRLAMADFAGGDVGTLTSWSITINYALPDAGIWTPVTGLFTDAAGTTPYVAGTPATTVYASPAATTTYSVTVANKSTETRTFSSGGSVTIPGIAPGSTASGAGTPYPSSIIVAGLPANAVIKSVTVKGVKHSFPDDIDMLLQSPTGTNVVLMSDVGGGTDLTGQNYTFNDGGNAMSDGSLNASGIYKPTNFANPDTYPAPLGSIDQASPALSLFTGDPNGTWNLYINDDLGGDVGSISNWEIAFTIPDTLYCTSAPRTVTVTVQAPIVFTTQPVNRTSCQNGTVTFTAAATGTITSTQWQVSTNGGTTWSDIAGATTTTLTLTNVQPSMNGYRYRLVLSNAGCGPVNSTVVTLTVNPLPTVSLSLNPSGQTQLHPGQVTTVTVNSSPAGASYIWSVNGTAQPSITTSTSSYVVDAYHLGTYTVRVTDVNGCVNTTSGVTFTAVPTTNLYVYPNPTSGAFYVTYYIPQAGTPVTIRVIDMKGSRIMEKVVTTSAPYTRFDFDASGLASGVYVIELLNSGGKRLDAKRLVVSR